MNGYQNISGKNKYLLVTSPFIRELTGFSEYKSIEQKISVTGALNVPDGYSCMVSMSTGGGKSLITQTVSYQHENGLTIIIVPTISLMLDQHKNAKKILKSYTESELYYYHSGLETEEILDAIQKQKARMLFLSPEALLKNSKFKETIEKANKSGYLRNIIIDEAHIIIEWGSSFRVDFQCIDSLRKGLLKDNPKLRTYLLSATYSKETASQIRKFYTENDRWIEIRCDKLRQEPHYDVIKAVSRNDKNKKMMKLIYTLPRPIIVYLRSPDEAEYIKGVLEKEGFGNVNTFTGKTNNLTREKLINKWADNEFDIIIATCAFGVGVDKSDVRTVLHLYIPENPNKYYQEAGRGGRDGLPCLSVILYEPDDITAAFNITQKVLTEEKIMGRWFSMLHSKKTIIKTDEIIIDTSIKPSYNERDTNYFETSDIDVSWNVYVILLLRRSGLIEINRVIFNERAYLFSLKVIDRNIMRENSEMEIIISKIRAVEVNFISSEFKLMKNSLDTVGKKCWSEMFNIVYNLTDEYCSGCNYHKNIIDEQNDDFPLRKAINHPQKNACKSAKKIMENSSNLLIKYELDIYRVIDSLIEKNIDMIVIPDNMQFDFTCLKSLSSKSLNIMNYYEFFKLSKKNNGYFLTGTIVIIYDEKCRSNEMMLSTVQKMRFTYPQTCLIHLIKNDFKLNISGKYISELIDGPLKLDYLLDMDVK
jgi:ATP-dependent DNA helicase RecQ